MRSDTDGGEETGLSAKGGSSEKVTPKRNVPRMHFFVDARSHSYIAMQVNAGSGFCQRGRIAEMMNDVESLCVS